MSDPTPDEHATPRIVDITAWIERARRDPLTYVERQATEVILAALGGLPGYRGRFFLKGGILMAVVYGSPRNTGDLDFTTDLPASPDLGERLRTELDRAFPRVCARLGYPDLLLRVQTVREMPRPFAGPRHLSFPALKLGIAFARRDDPSPRFLQKESSPNAVIVEVSFNEPVHAVELVRLNPDGPTIAAYGITDLIAEKLRALLQQVSRNRYRRQDVYDLAHLADRFSPDTNERATILRTLRDKCAARGIVPTAASLDDAALVERAQSEWHTLEQEIGELPDFDACLEKTRRLYRSLPWDDTAS